MGKKLTQEQQELFRKFIDTLSYYNAAESPQWGRESSSRNNFVNHMQTKFLEWYDNGISLETLEKFHDENKGLTNFYQMFPYRTLRKREKEPKYIYKEENSSLVRKNNPGYKGD